jgi:LuxR family transcriptional regulator, maltose regulon positive regulatory protein
VPRGADSHAAGVGAARKGGSTAFEVLRSKLDPPVLNPGLIERARLVDRLSRARSGRFVSLVAPPGYGKTTVLGQWAAKDPRSFAWVSLDRRDNDPVVLLTYIAEALNTDAAVDPLVFKGLVSRGDSVWARGLPRLGSAFAAREEPLVLVLDDVHTLEDPHCLDALVALALHVPVGSQLVFSGRTEPNVGLATMRANRELLEVDSRALALSDAEAHLLLGAAGAEVTTTEAAELNRHAEGWAAGLYLAALSIAAGSSSPASFRGDDRFVTDYLRAEELSRAGPEETEFLLRSAVLETMSGPFCDAVLERKGSAAMLEQLESENLFVVALDRTRSEYRYHHLFQEMLQAELLRRDSELVSTLNRRAAAWCEANGRPEDAIEYAAAAGDSDTLARIVAANVFPYYRGGRVTTVERWLTSFDGEELLRLYPTIAVFGVWLHAVRGRPDAAERWALAVEAAEVDEPMPDGSPFHACAAAIRALLARRGVEQMLTDADLAVAELTPTSPWRPASILLRAIATQLLGDAERAEVLFGEAAEIARASGAVWTGVVANSELALLALDRGDETTAEALLALAGEHVDDALSADYVMTAIQLAATARIAIARGEGARARQALASAQRLRPTLTHALPWFSVQVRLELAKAHLALKDPRGAATLYNEADGILRRRPRLGTLVAQAEEIRGRITSTAEESSGWASTLTAAELRLLPLLTTHLSFREIAERLFVSRNTVKTQAISVYRKLGASSRSEAIERAVALGLVDAAPGARGSDFTRSG